MNYRVVQKFVALVVIVIAFQSVEGARLSPQEALNRVQAASSRLSAPGNSSYELSYTGKSSDKEALYVFNRGDKGFIVVAADDRMPALLGYSDNGAFDIDKASPQLKWWLGQYADEATYCFDNEYNPTLTKTTWKRDGRVNIPALVKTKWNQSAPYNNDCPTDGGGRCVTGCVATAMAQVVNYHRYPVTGSGQYSYTDKGNTYSFDYGATTFDWDNMLDEYNGSATAQQNAAVAQLMYACGVSINMNYTSYESGTSDLYVPYALKTFFNFDEGVRYLEKCYFSNDEWEEMVYDELAAARPVIYGGQAPTGGHEFVCDGYEDGYFHINWGWGGYNDGMFLLSALDPGADQGIGSSIGGYNSDQSAIMGIRKPTGDSTPWYPIYAPASLGTPTPNGPYLHCPVNVYNYSPESVTVEFYLKAVPEANPEEEYFTGNCISYDFPGASRKSNGQTSTSGYSGIYVGGFKDLPAGNYKAYPYFKTPQGAMQPLLIPQTETAYIAMAVDAAGNITYSEGEPESKAMIAVTSFEPVGKVESGVSMQFDISLKNIGDVEYSGMFSIRVFSHGTDVMVAENNIGGVSLAAGETFNGYVNLTYDLPDAEYDVVCFDKYGEKISEVFPLYVGIDPPVAVTGITLDRSEAELEVDETLTLTATVDPGTATDKTVSWSSSDEDVAIVSEGVVTAVGVGEAVITASTSNGLTATCLVTVNEKEPEVILISEIILNPQSIKAVPGTEIQVEATILPTDATNTDLIWSSSDTTVAVVDENGLVTVLSAGTASVTAMATDGSGVTAICNVESMTGIEAILAAEGTCEIYDLNGFLLTRDADCGYLATLSSGIYIIRINGDVYKVVKK